MQSRRFYSDSRTDWHFSLPVVSTGTIAHSRSQLPVFAVIKTSELIRCPSHCSRLEMTSSGRSESLRTVSVEVSPGPSSVQLPGRPTRSLVWDYFKYDRVVDKSVCQVEKSNTDSICGKSVAGKKHNQSQAAF